MAHPVTWFQISGRDGSRLQSFYKDVFGWRIKPSADGTMGMVSPDKPGGIAGGVGASQNGNPSVAIYVNVKDLNAHLQKIEGAGGRMTMPPMDLPAGMGAIAGFSDPEGNWIGIWQPPTPKKAVKRAAARKSAKKPAVKAKRKAGKRR